MGKNLPMDDFTLRQKDAWAFLNCQIKAQKIMRRNNISGIVVLSLRDDIHIHGLAKWCKLLGIPYIREDWDGNEECDSNYDCIYFTYKGCKFFELVDKEHEGE